MANENRRSHADQNRGALERDEIPPDTEDSEGKQKEMISILKVQIVAIGDLAPTEIGTAEGISEVRVVTDDGAMFHISQTGPRSIHVRTPTGTFYLEPVAANVINLTSKAD